MVRIRPVQLLPVVVVLSTIVAKKLIKNSDNARKRPRPPRNGAKTPAADAPVVAAAAVPAEQQMGAPEPSAAVHLRTTPKDTNEKNAQQLNKAMKDAGATHIVLVTAEPDVCIEGPTPEAAPGSIATFFARLLSLMYAWRVEIVNFIIVFAFMTVFTPIIQTGNAKVGVPLCFALVPVGAKLDAWRQQVAAEQDPHGQEHNEQ